MVSLWSFQSRVRADRHLFRVHQHTNHTNTPNTTTTVRIADSALISSESSLFRVLRTHHHAAMNALSIIQLTIRSTGCRFFIEPHFFVFDSCPDVVVAVFEVVDLHSLSFSSSHSDSAKDVAPVIIRSGAQMQKISATSTTARQSRHESTIVMHAPHSPLIRGKPTGREPRIGGLCVTNTANQYHSHDENRSNNLIIF